MGEGEGGHGGCVVKGAPEREIRIEPVSRLEDLQGCVDLQIAVWGYSDGDVIPRRMFVVAQRIGGQVLGAFDGGRLVGFAMGLPGYREGSTYLHSHMLAVLPEYRDAGLGRRLKLAQREEAMAQGLDLIEWTFDPLEIKNAHLNLERLGAIARRYQADFYGPSTSPLQGGLPTDRLYAEWWLRSERVCQRVAGGRPERDDDVTVVERVEVPAEIYAWKAEAGERHRALEVQRRNQEALEGAFARGLAAVGYERDAEGNGGFLLGQPTGIGQGDEGRRT